MEPRLSAMAPAVVWWHLAGLRWPCAHSRGMSSINFSIKASSCAGLCPRKHRHEKAQGISRSVPVPPSAGGSWARLGGRGRKHLSSHNHLIIS